MDDETKQPLDLTGDFIALMEAGADADGTYQVKVIQEGWGTSGYYGSDMLKRDARGAFPAGTHMYWNHPTAQEMRARRGMRDMRDLAAVLVECADWRDTGFDGPGVYSRFKPFPEFAETIKAMGPYVGVSIHAAGLGEQGEVAGRKGTVVTALDEDRDGLNSVDFVPRAGAGGKYLTMFESALGGANQNAQPKEEAHNMADESKHELEEAQGRITALEADVAAREATIAERDATIAEQATKIAEYQADKVLAQAAGIIEAAVAEAKLPEKTAKRVSESLKRELPIKDGALDEAALTANVQTAIEEAVAEIASLRATGVSGMGSPEEMKPSPLFEAFKRKFEAQGLTAEESERRAHMAVTG